MAITQTEAEVIAIGASVGMPSERSADVKALEDVIVDNPTLRSVVNELGYYNEKADHLEAAGLEVGV